MKVIIAAAGTGGHINPGIAIANKIKKEDKNAKILFIGTINGLENDLVARAGYELKSIEAYGITRKINLKNIKNLLKTINGYRQAKKIMEEEKPDIVIGTGGYICGPAILAANKYKIPTILHESNAFPGITVKMLSSKVSSVLVGFEDAAKRLPKAKNIVVTGTPTKVKYLELNNKQKDKILSEVGIKRKLPVVLVFGGSQGAESINKTLINIIKNKKNVHYQILWACGQKQYDIIKEQLKKDNININNIPNVKVVPYIYNMEEIMNVCDIIIARSGAMTITEIANVGKPAIFIPYPFATENHQEYNARVLEKQHAAKIILDKDLDEEILSETLDKLLNNKDELNIMSNNAKNVCIENVEEKIYKEICKWI